MGLFLTLEKAAAGQATALDSRMGWSPFIREPFSGAFQRDIEWTVDTVAAFHAVFACITLIASDIGKLRPKLVELEDDGIWTEILNHPSFSAVLRRPNGFSNYIQHKEWWATSLLMRGNAYQLKERDNRGGQYQGNVRALYLLDPSRVTVLVAEDGGVYYELKEDNLSGLRTGVTVPASEIIHDRINCLFHPLVGLSPLFAAGATANVGLNIQSNSTTFFGRGSNPSGILTAPGEIKQATAERIKRDWEANYAGAANAGKVAVLGDSLDFKPLSMTAVDAQMIEHLKATAETICSVFHVPAFKIGAGAIPANNNAELLNQVYYSDCLQAYIERYELSMDDGLGLDTPKNGRTFGVELDITGLLRMDTKSQMETLETGVGAGILAPDEARKDLGKKAVPGGASPMAQQQNFSLAALAKRDAKEDPFATGTSEKPAPPEPPAAKPAPASEGKAYFDAFDKEFPELLVKAG